MKERKRKIVAKYEAREHDGALAGTIDVLDTGQAILNEWFKGKLRNNNGQAAWCPNLASAKRHWKKWCNGSTRVRAPWKRVEVPR